MSLHVLQKLYFTSCACWCLFAADATILSQLIYLAANHDRRITHVESLVAYHVGTNILVEVSA